VAFCYSKLFTLILEENHVLASHSLAGEREHTRRRGAARLLVAGAAAYDDFFEIAILLF
jgi:hypothetical protein